MYLSIGIRQGLMASVVVLAASCGKSARDFKVVDNFRLSAQADQNGSVVVQATTDLNLGGMIFPMLEIPVTGNGRNIGTIGLRRTLEGVNRLSLGINLTEVTQVRSAPAVLPNGAQLPIAGLPMFAVDAGARSRVYGAWTDDAAVIGVAVAIKEFDGIAKYAPGANIFYEFNSNGFRGVAGVFVGNGPGQSGIAFLVDATAVVTKLLAPKAQMELAAGGTSGDQFKAMSANGQKNSEMISMNTDVASVKASTIKPVIFVEVEPSNKRRDRLMMGLIRISNDRSRLRVY